MAKVIITNYLKEQVFKKFQGKSEDIFELMRSLENSLNKGKILGQAGGMTIKEIRFESFRFYFIVDGFKLKFLDQNELNDLIIKFIRMSDKKDQQKTIDEIKAILRTIGGSGFG
jgi:hypothetical protein